MNNALRWLHLTDLHRGQPRDDLWANFETKVAEELRALTDVGSSSGLRAPLDIVFFTGDLAYSGKAEQYALVTATLDEILGPDPQPVILSIPGNHDVDQRSHRAEIAEEELFRSNDRIRDRFFTDNGDHLRTHVRRALQKWTSWSGPQVKQKQVTQYTAGALPGDFVATVAVGDLKVGVVGLNTTFLQLTGGEARGQLTVDARQLQNCWGSPGKWAAAHHITVLLTHHPPEWLDKRGQDQLRDEIAPPGRFTLHLFGHQHEGDFTVRRPPGGGDRCELLGRSLFGLESRDKDQVQREHGFMAGMIQFVDGPKVRLWPRRAVRAAGGGWSFDSEGLSTQPDGGTRAEPVAARKPSESRGAVNDSTEKVLRVAYEAAKRELERMSTWWEDGNANFPGKRAVISESLRGVYEPAQEKLAEIRMAIDEREFETGWHDYAELRTILMPRLSHELLAVIGGLWLEEETQDRLPDSDLSYSRVATRLVGQLADSLRKDRPRILIVGEERREPFRAEPIRLRFPACDVWNLPFAAREYGYFIAQHQPVSKFQRLLDSVSDDVSGAKREEGHRRCYLERVRDLLQRENTERQREELEELERAHLCQLFAESFAAYFIGPAYVRALLFLGLCHEETLRVNRDTTPPFVHRFVFALETLKALRTYQSYFKKALEKRSDEALEEAYDSLKRTWCEAQIDRRPDLKYDYVVQTFTEGKWLKPMIDANITLDHWNIETKGRPVSYDWWEEACRLEREFPEAAETASGWSLVNAAWSIRVHGGDAADAEGWASSMLPPAETAPVG